MEDAYDSLIKVAGTLCKWAIAVGVPKEKIVADIQNAFHKIVDKHLQPRINLPWLRDKKKELVDEAIAEWIDETLLA